MKIFLSCETNKIDNESVYSLKKYIKNQRLQNLSVKHINAILRIYQNFTHHETFFHQFIANFN